MEAQEKEKNQILLIIIAILLVLLVTETGAVLVHLNSRARAGNKAVPHHSYAVNAESEPTQQAAASLAQTPVAYPHTYATRPRHMSPQQPGAQWGQNAMQDPFAALEQIQDRMNRLFDTALIYGPPAAQHLFSEQGGSDFNPAIDIAETDASYVVTCDLPGLDKDKINVNVSGTTLSIQGQREEIKENKDEKGGIVSQERSYGSFQRIVELPGPVDETKITADYKNGVLKINLPKTKEAEKPAQKVAIQ